jgi:hypothetical protein
LVIISPPSAKSAMPAAFGAMTHSAPSTNEPWNQRTSCPRLDAAGQPDRPEHHEPLDVVRVAVGLDARGHLVQALPAHGRAPVGRGQRQAASSALSCGHCSTRSQYIPHTYSRQPMIWRMKPSTLCSGARPAR